MSEKNRGKISRTIVTLNGLNYMKITLPQVEEPGLLAGIGAGACPVAGEEGDQETGAWPAAGAEAGQGFQGCWQ
jgi:hypothetical protein